MFDKKKIYFGRIRGDTLSSFLFHAVMMFLFPILVFFNGRKYLRQSLSYSEKDSNIYAGIGAVVCVNVVIFHYIITVYRDKDNWDKGAQKDAEKAARKKLNAQIKDSKHPLAHVGMEGASDSDASPIKGKGLSEAKKKQIQEKQAAKAATPKNAKPAEKEAPKQKVAETTKAKDGKATPKATPKAAAGKDGKVVAKDAKAPAKAGAKDNKKAPAKGQPAQNKPAKVEEDDTTDFSAFTKPIQVKKIDSSKIEKKEDPKKVQAQVNQAKAQAFNDDDFVVVSSQKKSRREREKEKREKENADDDDGFHTVTKRVVHEHHEEKQAEKREESGSGQVAEKKVQQEAPKAEPERDPFDFVTVEKKKKKKD